MHAVSNYVTHTYLVMHALSNYVTHSYLVMHALSNYVTHTYLVMHAVSNYVSLCVHEERNCHATLWSSLYIVRVKVATA